MHNQGQPAGQVITLLECFLSWHCREPANMPHSELVGHSPLDLGRLHGSLLGTHCRLHVITRTRLANETYSAGAAAFSPVAAYMQSSSVIASQPHLSRSPGRGLHLEVSQHHGAQRIGRQPADVGAVRLARVAQRALARLLDQVLHVRPGGAMMAGFWAG